MCTCNPCTGHVHAPQKPFHLAGLPAIPSFRWKVLRRRTQENDMENDREMAELMIGETSAVVEALRRLRGPAHTSLLNQFNQRGEPSAHSQLGTNKEERRRGRRDRGENRRLTTTTTTRQPFPGLGACLACSESDLALGPGRAADVDGRRSPPLSRVLGARDSLRFRLALQHGC